MRGDDINFSASKLRGAKFQCKPFEGGHGGGRNFSARLSRRGQKRSARLSRGGQILSASDFRICTDTPPPPVNDDRSLKP